MKEYTPEEKEEARKKLPKPIGDFTVSPALADAYARLAKKHGFNLREIGRISESTDAILLNLEPETSLGASIREALPNLSAAKVQELLLDLNSSVFAEARRQLAESSAPQNEPVDD